MAEEATKKLQELFGVKWQKNLHQALQQKKALLRQFVTVVPDVKSRNVQFTFTGTSEMSRITNAFQSVSTENEQKFGRVGLYPVPFYDVHKFTNDQELYNNDLDWTIGSIIEEVRAAASRKMDQIIIGSDWDTTNSCFKVNDATAAPADPYATSQPFGILGTRIINQTTLKDFDLTNNSIAADFHYDGSATAAGMMADKIVRGLRILTEKHALERGVTTPVLILSSRQVEDIQNWESAYNKNYGFGDYKKGNFSNRVLGVEVMISEQLPYKDPATKKVRINPLFIKEHIKFGLWQDVKVRVEKNAPNAINWGRVITTMSMGCTRLYDESVVAILSQEEAAGA